MEDARWMRKYPDGTETADNQAVPGVADAIAAGLSAPKPLVFPAAEKVVWFSLVSNLMWWDGAPTTYSISAFFPCLYSAQGWSAYNSGSQVFAVLDGVNTATIGLFSSSAPACASTGMGGTIEFDFWTNTFTATEDLTGYIPGVIQTLHSEAQPEEKANIHMTYTINGRAFHLSESTPQASAYPTLDWVLNGPTYDPFETTQPDIVSSMARGFTNTYYAQGGFDYIGYADSSGDMWLADYGHDDGGMFQCGNDDYLGIARTNVKALFMSPTCPDGADCSVLASGCRDPDGDGHCNDCESLSWVPSIGAWVRVCDPAAEDCSTAQISVTNMDGSTTLYLVVPSTSHDGAQCPL